MRRSSVVGGMSSAMAYRGPRRLHSLALGVILVTSIVGSSSVAAAQQRSRRNVIKLGETTIEGRIQKPQAFYILQRSNLSFEGLELKNSFIPKIVKSVEKAPF